MATIRVNIYNPTTGGYANVDLAGYTALWQYRGWELYDGILPGTITVNPLSGLDRRYVNEPEDVEDGEVLVWNADDQVWVAATIEGGGGGEGDPTNLSYNAATRLLSSSTGTDVTLPLAGADPGLMSAADKTAVDNIDEAIGTAIDALLDGAPGALNTLNELAAAVNDDASFAATVTAALAGKQPLATVLTNTTAAFTTAQETKLGNIETLADVTDATNVDAAGAVMNSDASTAAMSFVVDEDNMASNSATKVPTQQSVKAYVDTEIAGVDTGGGGINTTGTITAADFAKFTDSDTLEGRSASEVRSDLGLVIGTHVMAVDGRRNITVPTDSGAGSSFDDAIEKVTVSYAADSETSPDLESVKVNGVVRTWRNEWGALRGRSPYTWGDALVRATVESADALTTGNAFEIVDRTIPAGPERQRWGRQWTDGALIRNGILMNDSIVLTEVESVPTGLPAGTIIVRTVDP